MFKCFYPGVRYESVYAIDFNKYYELGYRAVLFDIDNTLVEHDAPANEKAVQLFAWLKQIGFRVCLVSNNEEPRVKPFAEKVKGQFICHANKPKADGFVRAMKMLGVSREETMMVGDQLFTDMWGANNAGILAVYTKPIARDPHFYIRLKRAGENVVSLFYSAYEKKHGAAKYIKTDRGKK